jgi:hypothetical protein
MLAILSVLLACVAWLGGTPTVSPAVAAPRDWVNLAGVATSDGRPRVWLRGSDDTPTRRAKVIVTSDGAVRLRVPPVPRGAYDLLVRLPGAAAKDIDDLLVMPDALRVEVPSDLSVGPSDTKTTARPGDVLELTGRFLGSRRGWVEVASRRARVLSWESGQATDADGLPTGRVRFRVPRRIGTGHHPITVTTAAGEGWLAEAVEVTQSDHGVEPVLRADAGGLRLEAKAATVGWETVTAPGSEESLILLRAFDGRGKRGHWMSLSLRYDPTVQGPVNVRGDDAIMQLVRVAPGDGQVWSSAYGWGGHVRVHILENQDGLLSGTVSGWLAPVYGKAEALPIAGSFVAAPR